MKIAPEDAFQALLEGRVRRSPADLAALGALAKALEPNERTSADPRFARRLRSELLAAASTTPSEIFAAAIEDPTQVRAGSKLAALVSVASSLDHASKPLPEPSFRYDLRRKVISLSEAEGAPAGARGLLARIGGRSVKMRRSLRIVLVTGALAAITMVSSATMVVAQDALPGDLTYRAKLIKESVGLWTVSGHEEGLRKLDHSRKRLSEVRGLSERGETRGRLYTATLDRMDALTLDAADLILEGLSSGAPAALAAVERLSAFADAQVADLGALLERLPPEVLPAARDSLGVIENTGARATAALDGACDACEEPSDPDPVTGPSGEGNTPVAAGPCSRCGSGGETSDPEVTDPSGDPSEPGPKDPGGDPGSGGEDPEPPAPTDDDPAIDLPPVDQTTVDEDVEEAVDDLLDRLGIKPTVAPPAAPSVPSTSGLLP